MDYVGKYKIKLDDVYNNIPVEIKEARKNPFTYENQENNLYVYYDINLISEIANKTNELSLKARMYLVIKKKMRYGKLNFCFKRNKL